MGMEYRPYYLAKEFVKTGHNVSIIGASFSHVRNIQPTVKEDLSLELIDNVAYYWIKTPAYRGNILRIINILVFILKLYFYRRKISKITKPDLVIASSTYPLDIYAARRISKISGAKLIFEVHDLWPLTPMTIGGYSKYHPYIYLMQRAECYAYKHSYKVISLLGNAREHMVVHGLDPDKFIHIPNGFDRDEYQLMQGNVPVEHLQKIENLKKDGKILIGYTGGHAISNAMHSFVSTAHLFRNDSRVFFVSVGNGPCKKELQLQAGNLLNILFLPPVPKKSVHQLLPLFDILYVGFAKSEIHKFGISPNKLIDYMLAAKPVILSAEVENEIVEKVGCGITVPAENPAAIYAAISEMLKLSEAERLEMGSRGRNYALKEMDYKELAGRFLNSI